MVACTDIDECAAEKSPCHENAVCKNTAASHECKCKEDFVGDGVDKCVSCSPKEESLPYRATKTRQLTIS